MYLEAHMEAKLVLMERQATRVAEMRKLLQPLYAGTSIPLGVAAELLLGIVEVFGTTEVTMQSVVAIFSSLLPAGNALPSSYKGLKSIVSRMGGLTWERSNLPFLRIICLR